MHPVKKIAAPGCMIDGFTNTSLLWPRLPENDKERQEPSVAKTGGPFCEKHIPGFGGERVPCRQIT